MAEKKTNVLLLIDANALIHRFFHALPPLTTPDGQPIQAIYGLCGILLKILREQKPEYVAAAFDRPEPTFRDEIFKDYKAHRPPTADDLVPQIIRAREVFEAFGIKSLDVPGFEADDIIGTLTEQFRGEPDFKIVILSGDNDLLQLVIDEKVVAQIVKTGLSETVIYNEKGVEEKYGLKPNQLADYKGMVGDTSDNIPGIKGVGPKTAQPLLKEYGNLEEVFASIGIIPEKISKKLEGQKEIALMSKKLATIRRDAPVAVSGLSSLAMEELNKEKLSKYFTELGFKSLVERLNK
ncbi:MAG: 5'-3' exonuclease H3TH domain-containing protein [Patescibacteria group bacterium]